MLTRPTVPDAIAAVLLAVFVVACTVAGFSINVAVGFYSLAVAALVASAMLTWS